ncbi:hypothetical protein V6Z11_A12G071800 [Gossypium hirsutum]
MLMQPVYTTTLMCTRTLHGLTLQIRRFPEALQFPPFGAGPRTCLGINMAKVAMLVFVHRLTSGYKWTLDDPDSSLERKEHIPRLRSGCPITLKALNKGK